MVLIRDVVQQAITTGYLRVWAEERLRQLSRTKYDDALIYTKRATLPKSSRVFSINRQFFLRNCLIWGTPRVSVEHRTSTRKRVARFVQVFPRTWKI